MHALRDTMDSPWVYATLFLLAWLDGFLPAFPSESAVIVAGVFAAHGTPWAPVAGLCAALGAFAGDHTSYLIGRVAGTRLIRRLAPPGGRRAAAVGWASRTLACRGGLILVVARYVPGGRTTVTLTAGTVGLPLLRFTPFAALAALSWGAYGTLIGYFGGMAFEHHPLRGVLFGLGLALGLTTVVELTRFLLRRRRSGGHRLIVDQAGLVGDDRGLDPVLHLEPAEDRADVGLHRALDEEESPADLGIGKTRGHQREHVPLAVAQCGHLAARGRGTGHPSAAATPELGDDPVCDLG